jgi:hypothetical protein
MKLLPCILAILVVVTLGACNGDPGNGNYITEPVVATPSGSIDGEFFLDPSTTGSIANTQVALYKSEEDFRNRKPVKVVQTDAQGRYFIMDVCCGQYYIDAWKDNDGSSSVSTGDYYLAHRDCNGTACTCAVQQGSPASFCGKLDVVR